ncbi:MAG: DUF418 domain-containing protein [Gammaproteobacteria bacterium]|nr:DUF418 domain-containing protein [Gammaproteobacteria bacterium]
MNAVTDAEIDATASGVTAEPVSSSERLISLDVLRGVAVLGILVMNIYAFAMPFIAYSNPLAMGGLEPLNIGTWFFTHILFDQKFMSIFSMLFGAGMILMAERAEEQGVRFAGILYRRQFWLLVLGLIHAYLIWFGDILFFYAVVGMIIYVFRKKSPITLIVIASLLLPVTLLFSFAGGTYMQDLKIRAEALLVQQAAGETLSEADQATIDEWAEERSFLVPGQEELEKELIAYSGGYADNLEHRVPFVWSFQMEGLPFFIVWRVGGMMLIGMALMKLGILSAKESVRLYRNLMIAGYTVGLPLTTFSAVNAYWHAFEPLYMLRVGMIPNYIGSIFVALGHIGLVMLIVKTGVLRVLVDRFAAVGRMALTNYLMHSVVMTTIFYGYGFGLYGTVPRFWQMWFAVGLVALQLALSPWWLARYRFGPAEWLWRSLTYGQRQAMRRRQ